MVSKGDPKSEFGPTRPVDLFRSPEEPTPSVAEELIDADTDPEVKAIVMVLKALYPLSREARKRVVQWVTSRLS